MLDSEFLQNFKYVISFVLRFVELPNIGSKKKLTCLFAIYCYENSKNRYLEKYVFIFGMQFFNILCVISQKIGFYNRFFLKSRFLKFYTGEGGAMTTS